MNDTWNSGLQLYDNQSLVQRLVISKWEGAFLEDVEHEVHKFGCEQLHETRHHIMDQPALKTLLEAAIPQGVRFGSLDGRWNQRYYQCVHPNGSVGQVYKLGTSPREEECLAVPKPFIYHGRNANASHCSRPRAE